MQLATGWNRRSWPAPRGLTARILVPAYLYDGAIPSHLETLMNLSFLRNSIPTSASIVWPGCCSVPHFSCILGPPASTEFLHPARAPNVEAERAGCGFVLHPRAAR